MAHRVTAATAACIIFVSLGVGRAAESPGSAKWTEPTRLKPQWCSAEAAPPALSAAPRYVPGVLAFIDPVSGKRAEPTAAQLREWYYFHALTEVSRTDGLVSKAAPGGGYEIDLQGRFQVPMVRFLDVAGAPAPEGGRHD